MKVSHIELVSKPLGLLPTIETPSKLPAYILIQLKVPFTYKERLNSGVCVVEITFSAHLRSQSFGTEVGFAVVLSSLKLKPTGC